MKTWVERAQKESYTIDDSGRYFLVYVYDDFVVKIPKKEKNNNPFFDKKTLINMAECQNELSKHMDSVDPCFIDDGKVYTKRAKGIRGDHLSTQDREKAKVLLKTELSTVDRLGYWFNAKPHMKNIFYHEGKIKLIDFHRIGKKEIDTDVEAWVAKNMLQKSRWAQYQTFYWNNKKLLKGRRNLQERYNLIDKNDIKGKSVVDLGCNIGMCCHWAVETGAVEAFGLDFKEDYVKLATGLNEFLHNPCLFLRADLSNKLTCEKKFDVGFVFAINQHVNNDFALAQNIKSLVTEVVYFETNMQSGYREMPDEIKAIFSDIKFLGNTDKGRRKFYRCTISKSII